MAENHHLPPLPPTPPPQTQAPPLIYQHHLPPEKPMAKGKPSHYTKTSSTKRSICTFITILLLLAGITLLVLWLVYRPHKPRFTVVGAAVYSMNTTTLPLMSTTMQFTILIRNPNKRTSIYYDRFSAFVSYRNQAITPKIMLPPLYLEKHSTVSLSPVIGGTPVPVSVEVSNGLMVDEAYGVVGLKLVFLGRLRWKVGAIRTSHYGLYVKCDMLIGLKKGFVGQVPLLGAPPCKVDV
ncbi:PREDICTED: NDR1/HIN1-like protein 12 [Lupinus angustifolius]|uniref:NDR1/HIN1-like protein 12 n=1 Tax=Lupinus angustifolius TaxID=3871 RepID=UPI00092FD59E|nr:PREDICTED: NDR1/HIN1-like protein 12 [Lupinus angustifolius]XP_019440466.1 PREDICTED: NDR1/HIN1-like protein 12 [Lupinus angustifolius]XP_019440467.1 PREDICTED: NDR1/HIN1-like protein 12 [Lupinus angustifolius]